MDLLKERSQLDLLKERSQLDLLKERSHLELLKERSHLDLLKERSHLDLLKEHQTLLQTYSTLHAAAARDSFVAAAAAGAVKEIKEERMDAAEQTAIDLTVRPETKIEII